MTRSVYVTGIGRGDGRQVIELGVMELLTRQVDRVGVFRPLAHEGPDPVFELLRGRYRLAQSPASARGMEYAEAAVLHAEHGTDELVGRVRPAGARGLTSAAPWRRRGCGSPPRPRSPPASAWRSRW